MKKLLLAPFLFLLIGCNSGNKENIAAKSNFIIECQNERDVIEDVYNEFLYNCVVNNGDTNEAIQNCRNGEIAKDYRDQISDDAIRQCVDEKMLFL